MRGLLEALFIVISARPALADWKDEVADQLMHEVHCVVLFYTDVVEEGAEGELTVFARAHCED